VIQNVNILWYSTRGSAIVSQILFTAVTVLGILTAVRWQTRSWPRFMSEGLHRTLALTSLFFLAFHVVTSAIDPFTALGWESVVLPFAVDYKRIGLGLGSVALYLLAAITITSLIRDRIGLRTWRVVHWLSYAFWPVAMIHGIGTGSDTNSLWMYAINVACIAAVGAAVVWRVFDAASRRPLAADVPPRVAVEQSPMLNPAAFPEGPRVEAGTYVPLPPTLVMPPDADVQSDAPEPESTAGQPPAASDPVDGSPWAAPAARPAQSGPTVLAPPQRLPIGDRLLAGPQAPAGAESYADHRTRLGRLPLHGPALIPALEQTGLLGRGGAGFPVGRKWRSVAERSHGDAVILANGAEGKPTSRKDRVLMALRPHLVLDGALIAANAVGANEVVMFIGQEHRPASEAMARAIAERQSEFTLPVRLVEAPLGYVVGEASAAVHYVNDGPALPTASPPRVWEHGVHGRPTVVQNVESLAYAALIARYGPDWYRAAGRAETPGTALVTVSGTTPAQRVIEIEFGTTLGEVLNRVGALTTAGQGVMLGDSFGAWADVHDALRLPLDPEVMRRHGVYFGAGVIAVMPATTCGVVQTAQTMAYMAGENAGQCGPCVYGMKALAEATQRLAERRPAAGDLDHVARWGSQLAGRGACAHPDGAAAFLNSGLRIFAREFALHERGMCSVPGGAIAAPAG
jgi:NADH:ubiquinone oxidoreductase subunit F (NADH-binding)/DMSO/TMAO reductase YedYZ heme-binding membrane subunit